MSRNIDKLNEACTGMSYTDMMCFKAMFIGSLSSKVTDKKWDESLEVVKKIFQDQKKGEK